MFCNSWKIIKMKREFFVMIWSCLHGYPGKDDALTVFYPLFYNLLDCQGRFWRWFCFWSWRCTPLDGFILYYTSQWYPWDSCAHYLLKAPRAYRHENVKNIQSFVGRIKFLWTLLLDMWRILCMPPFPLPRKVIHLPFGACTPTQI